MREARTFGLLVISYDTAATFLCHSELVEGQPAIVHICGMPSVPEAAGKGHEHVIPRKELRLAILRHPDRVEPLMRLAVACIVTHGEQKLLSTALSEFRRDLRCESFREHEAWLRPAPRFGFGANLAGRRA